MWSINIFTCCTYTYVMYVDNIIIIHIKITYALEIIVRKTEPTYMPSISGSYGKPQNKILAAQDLLIA